MLRRINDRMVETTQATSVYTSTGSAYVGEGIIKGLWISPSVALTDLAVSAHDTATTSGSMAAETKLTPGTINKSFTALDDWYLNMHDQYFASGVYVTMTTTSGAFEYVVIYE
jgi:hypothetical protein